MRSTTVRPEPTPPSMAAAADYTILEVGELKEVGEIHPDEIHTQSVLVDAVVEKGGKA